MAKIAEQLIFLPVSQRFGAQGVEALRVLLAGVRRIYSQLSTERLPQGITIVREVGESTVASLPDAQPIHRDEGLLNYADGPLTVELSANFEVRALPVGQDPAEFGESWLVYRWHPHEGEHVYLAGVPYTLPNVTNAPAALAIPYFVDLEDALDHYALHKSRRPGQCLVLADAWRDENRLMLIRKPEATMRKSLHAHLVSSLRNYQSLEVMAEQIVDESHPVDLKVTWLGTNKVALIEVKWLGKSAPTGKNSPLTPYSDSRAVAGAQQLASYLDSYKTYSAGQDARGYLVVFDARRRGVQPSTTSVETIKGMFYQFRDVKYPPEILQRGDFATPRRFFCEPRCTI